LISPNHITWKEYQLTNLNQNINRNINTLVLGSIGSGKSHLLKIPIRKILRLDDTDNIKKSANLLLQGKRNRFGDFERFYD
jgi:DNA replication protein DnaC